MRVPWGLLILLVIAADAYSLWWIFDSVRAEEGAFVGLIAPFLYAAVAFTVGVWVIRFAGGLSMWNAFRRARSPADLDKALLDGLVILIAALLLMWPGVASDAIALVLLFPGTRIPVRAWLRKRAVVRNGGINITYESGGRARRERERAPEDGGAVDVDDYRVE